MTIDYVKREKTLKVSTSLPTDLHAEWKSLQESMPGNQKWPPFGAALLLLIDMGEKQAIAFVDELLEEYRKVGLGQMIADAKSRQLRRRVEKAVMLRMNYGSDPVMTPEEPQIVPPTPMKGQDTQPQQERNHRRQGRSKSRRRDEQS